MYYIQGRTKKALENGEQLREKKIYIKTAQNTYIEGDLLRIHEVSSLEFEIVKVENVTVE